MKVQKKFVKTLCAVLFPVLPGVESCMELCFSYEEVALKSEDAPAILRRTPEAAITEEDKALLEELLQCSSVREMPESMKKR